MLFGVDSDSGTEIRLYLIPDSGGSTPTIVVANDGVDLLRLPSNQLRQEIADFGRHATGQCGFVVDTTLLPDLASYANLEIREPDNQIILYRRPRADFRQTRLFRLETHLLPLWRFDEALSGYFQYWMKGIDRYGRETANQSFNLINTESVYSSGRMYMRTVEKFIARGLKAVALVRDPYDELAERLIILRNVGEQRTDLLGARDAMLYEETIAALAELAVFDQQSCRRFFRRAPQDVVATLSSPLVRQLTLTNPTEAPPASCVGISLQMLSQFTVLGLRSDAEDFSRAVAELLDIEPAHLPVMREFGKVSQLGNLLREIREVESVLEQDLELYHQLKQAFGAAATPPATA